MSIDLNATDFLIETKTYLCGVVFLDGMYVNRSRVWFQSISSWLTSNCAYVCVSVADCLAVIYLSCSLYMLYAILLQRTGIAKLTTVFKTSFNGIFLSCKVINILQFESKVCIRYPKIINCFENNPEWTSFYTRTYLYIC